MVLTDEQLRSFQSHGFVKLLSALPAPAVNTMVDRIWSFLAQSNGIDRDDSSTWRVERPVGFQSLTRADAFAAVANKQVVAALDQLLGEHRWRMPKHWGAPLVVFPRAGKWNVPHDQWHLDFTVDGVALPGIRILALLSDTPRDGGTTLVLSGSHTLLTHLRERGELPPKKSSDIRRWLMTRYDWVHSLCSPSGPEATRVRLMEHGCEVAGIPIRIVALDGKPGDVFLMHPWSFHAPSENVSTSPRIMVSESVFATGS